MLFELTGQIRKAVPSKDASKTYLTVDELDGSEYNLTIKQPAGQFQDKLMTRVKLTGRLTGRVFVNDGRSQQVLNVEELQVKPV